MKLDAVAIDTIQKEASIYNEIHESVRSKINDSRSMPLVPDVSTHLHHRVLLH